MFDAYYGGSNFAIYYGSSDSNNLCRCKAYDIEFIVNKKNSTKDLALKRFLDVDDAFAV